MRAIRVIVTLFLMALLAVIQAPVSNALPVIVEIKNHNSPFCIAVANASTVNGASTVQWDCQGYSHEAWIINNPSLAWSPIKNENSGQCLAIGNGSDTPGAKAIQWPCNGQAEQLWSISPESDTSPGHPRSLVNYKTRQCLAIGGGSQARGAAVIQWPCNGQAEQKWEFYAL
jgi:hypothetical protein